MLATPNEFHLRRFRELVAQRLGLQFDDARQDMVAAALSQGLALTGRGDYALYLEWLAQWPASRAGWQALAERLTINETYFFRNPDHFKVFTQVVLPECVEGTRCSSRQIAVSVGRVRLGRRSLFAGNRGAAIHLPDSADWDIKIIGLDVNPLVRR